MASTAAVRAPAGLGLRAEVLEGLQALDSLEVQWARLWEDSHSDCPYCHPDWVRAYLSAFEAGCELLVLAVFSGMELAAVLPLIRETARFRGFPIRKLRTPTNPHVTRFEILRAPGSLGASALTKLWKTLLQVPAWDIAEIEVLCEETARLVQTAAAEHHCGLHISQHGSIIIPIARYADNPLKWQAELSSHMRWKLRRVKKKLEARSGACELTLTDYGEPETVEEFYRIEGSGWKGTGGTNTAILCAENTHQFYNEVADRFTKRGIFTVYTYRAGGQAVAGAYAIRAHGREVVLKLGFLEDFGECAPGLLLVNDMLRTLWDQGATELDFGPDNNYKHHWTENVVPRLSCTVYNNSLYAKALYRIETNLKPIVKKWMSSAPSNPGDDVTTNDSTQ
jgi:CelD/BcsL family acetyltransferase involved in cellulose biosynthesis